ncbi:MAG: PAS domain-containing protein [Acidobacteria bacterium]|nr:PAS domain-containing protein [Acidobacteriota bacterium]
MLIPAETLAVTLGPLDAVPYTCRLDKQLSIVSMGEEIVRLTGYAAAEFTTNPAFRWERIHADDRGRVLRELSQGVPSAGCHLEYRWLAADGTYIWFSDSLCAAKTDGGELLFGIWRRMSEGPQGTFREATREFAEMQRLARVGSWRWDVESDAVTWSEELYRIAGLDPKRPAPGFQAQARLYTPESFARLSTAVEKTLTTGEPYELETELLRADGATRWIVNSGAAEYDKCGRVACLRGTSHDITERKAAESQLQLSEERLRLITENINEVFWMADVDIEKTFYISAGYEKVWGRSRELLYQNPRSFLEAVHPEDLDRVLADLEAQQKGEPFDHEYRIVRPDGSIRWIRDRGFPIREAGEPVRRYVGLAEDVTHKRDEVVLRESEALLRSCYDCPGTLRGVFEIVDGRIVPVATNTHVLAFISESREAGADTETGIVSFWIDRCEESRKTGRAAHFEFHSRDPAGGDWFYVHVHSLGTGPDGHPRYAYVALDISDRKRIEEQLRHAEEKFRLITENTSDFITIATADGNWIYFNPTHFTKLGYDREELLSMRPNDLVHPDDREQPAAWSREPLALRFRKKNGEWLWAEGVAFPILLDGQPAFVGVARDITARRKAEQERERLVTELTEALTKVKTLSGLVPICASCKKIRDDSGFWQQVETYIENRTSAEFTHGICPECMDRLYPDYK